MTALSGDTSNKIRVFVWNRSVTTFSNKAESAWKLCLAEKGIGSG